MSQIGGVLRDLENQRQRAERWRAKAGDWKAEAERLRTAIRDHQRAVTVDENFGADDALWIRAGYVGRKGPGGRPTASTKPYARVAA